eukprot:CAMPEP_0170099532 /NCGR_PEP_ID=MMETSP0020_2-20130122/1088_1 /TAXON_ID=98059 /ORGANISM="Dinobryon sp., Strain UTEXLB2267" /LENGTH=165 /DNA_ID=CAMNT_0010322193 /DNA_START=645 /DNA_END=1142 /DNA_ORIENTATION=+
MIRREIPDDNGMSMQLLLGYIGVVNAVVLSPVLLLMFLMKWDNLWQLSGKIFGFLVLSGLCDNVLSDYLWARSVVLTSPTVATIGMSITIPLAMLSDSLLNHAQQDAVAVLGAMLVLIGFVMVNISRQSQMDLEMKLRSAYQYIVNKTRGKDTLLYHSVENSTVS